MTHDVLLDRLKTLTAFRVFFVTGLLGTFFVFKIGFGVFPYPQSVLYIIALLYTVSIFYALLLGRVPTLLLAYIQMSIDVLSVTALIFMTGGIESWFSSLLNLTVVAASIVVSRRAGYYTAALSSIMYGMLLDMQFYKDLPLAFDPKLLGKDFIYDIFSHIAALFMTAFLTGQLSSRLEKRSADLLELSVFNRRIIENTPSGLLTTDAEGRIEIFNRAAEQITGLQRSDIKGRHIDTVFPFIKIISEMRRAEVNIMFGGAEKTIELTVSSMRDAAGAHTGYIGMFQDLTELRRMAEEIKQKENLANLGELSANIAHEIRNPLASLKSSIELLKEGALDAAQRARLMDIAINEMDRLNRIITDFLDFSKPRPPEMQEFDLHAALEETLELLRVREQRPVRIIRQFSGRLLVNADRQKLQQVFWNIGINALNAIGADGTVSVGTSVLQSSVDIWFEDNGKGIRPEHIKKIFLPFFTTRHDGTGLGLSNAYRIAEGHNGTIKVKSSPNQGARFDVVLPIVVIKEEKETGASAA